jgi:hypothetical protein
VDTLNEKSVETAHFLTTNPKRKLGCAGVILAKETGSVVLQEETAPDVCGLNPDVT